MVRIAAVAALMALCMPAAASSMAYERRVVLGLPVNAVTVNLNNPKVTVTAAVAKSGPGASEPFMHLINRVHPAAAITGTFFDTRSLLPVGDIVVAGRPGLGNRDSG
ncbi:MAG: hypothetical protein HY321_02575 [Armatimonadetes bacterium]|nr:hypothetical protein [Armatimonadota bacterium]